MLSHYLIKDYYYKYIVQSTPLSRQCFFKELNDKKIIFIHIPKTAGTSIGRALRLPPPHRSFGIRKHVTADMAHDIAGNEVWESSLKFACVRNPWAKFFSHFKFKKKHGLLKGKKADLSFNEWGKLVLQREDLKMVRSQSDWIRTTRGQSELDLIIRFESLEEGVQILSEKLQIDLKIPHLLKSTYNVTYRDAYERDLRDLVSEKYREDIERFGYMF